MWGPLGKKQPPGTQLCGAWAWICWEAAPWVVCQADFPLRPTVLALHQLVLAVYALRPSTVSCEEEDPWNKSILLTPINTSCFTYRNWKGGNNWDTWGRHRNKSKSFKERVRLKAWSDSMVGRDLGLHVATQVRADTPYGPLHPARSDSKVQSQE